MTLPAFLLKSPYDQQQHTMATSPRILHCKKAQINEGTGTLQVRLRAALDAKPLVADRAENIGANDSKAFQVVAQHYNSVGGGVAGIFASFEHGTSAVSILDTPQNAMLRLEQLQAPMSEDGTPREWVDGLMYFYVFGDFVILIQSASVRSRRFEDHLSWLFRANGAKVGPSVVLADQPTENASEMIKRSHVKAIRVGGSFLEANSNQAEQPSNATVALSGTLLSGLKEMLGRNTGFNWADGLDGNLKAWLHITYTRTTTESAHRLLDKIGTTFRNSDELETELELTNGQTISNSDMRLRKRVNIETKEGVLVADKAFDAMHGWFKELVEAKQLVA